MTPVELYVGHVGFERQRLLEARHRHDRVPLPE
jgi:hypothetical protein